MLATKQAIAKVSKKECILYDTKQIETKNKCSYFLSKFPQFNVVGVAIVDI
ncbi:hypothetical protein Lepto7376_2713 [[Leptolyngbya] sp. PCC 7376]|nr:hypothetical protein Lepto7376_2713 [[Leptolyngbya] sp. PCC 7376]